MSEHDDWKERQAIQMPLPRVVEPTIGQRIRRLSPSERREVQLIVRSLYLRKAIRRTLAEAFHSRAPSMQQLRTAVRTPASVTSYERELTPSSEAIQFTLMEQQ